MSNKIDKLVITHVACCLGIEPDQVSLDMDLFRDLGVDGDDAIDLIASFSEKFQVDVTNFDIRKHFGPERPISILRAMFYGFESKGKNFIPLTIKDLIKAAENHSLS